MRTEKNVAQIFVGDAVVKSHTIDALETNEIALIVEGETTSDDLSDALGSGETFRVVLKDSNGKLHFSNRINPDSANYRTLKQAQSAATEQIEYIGYNGTSGSIDVINSNVYAVRLDLIGTTVKEFNRRYIKEGFYESGASATEYAIATGIAKSLTQNFSREAEKDLKAERVNSGTGVATAGGAVSVSHGSEYITIVESSSEDDAGEYDTSTEIAVGDFIRFGSDTDTEYPVYKVTSVSGVGTASATIGIDLPYQGETESIAAADVGVIASADEGDWGVKLTGIERDFQPGLTPYTKATWSTQLLDFGDTTLTEDQAASKGVGTYEEVAALEAQFLTNKGGDYVYRASTPAPSLNLNANSSDAPYDIYVIEAQNEMSTALGDQVNSPFQVYIALDTDGSGDTDLESALDIS